MPTEHVLNEHTGTVHKLRTEPTDDGVRGESIDEEVRGEATGDEAVCGALRHVSQRHVAAVANGRARTDGEIDRCGRCFEDAGGY